MSTCRQLAFADPSSRHSVLSYLFTIQHSTDAVCTSVAGRLGNPVLGNPMRRFQLLFASPRLRKMSLETLSSVGLVGSEPEVRNQLSRQVTLEHRLCVCPQVSEVLETESGNIFSAGCQVWVACGFHPSEGRAVSCRGRSLPCAPG